MKITTVLRIIGILLLLLSLTFIPPLLMFIEYGWMPFCMSAFAKAFMMTFCSGAVLFFLFRGRQQPLRTQDGFILLVLFWVIASVIGALPFWLGLPMLSFTDALFEATSGMTTTGATIFTQLESLPRPLLYYRQQLQFVGGLSVLISAVAILPMLGIGGMQYFRAEMTGPIKDDKLTPRFMQTTKGISIIYFCFMVLCALCYYLAGMTFFDAIGHSFSTVSTGGFSTHNENFSYFNQQPFIKIIALFFMFLSALSFHLHFYFLKRRQFKVYTHNVELRFFIKMILSAILFIAIALLLLVHPLLVSGLDILFQVVSFATTSGFSSTDLQLWPLSLAFILLFLGWIGACAGSTSGGFKSLRGLLLLKQSAREIKRLVHPHGQYTISLGKTPLSSGIIESIWGFFVIYVFVFFIFLLLLLLSESDFLTAYTALVATFSNTGRGLGSVATHFNTLSEYAKWMLSLAMIVGRLEILTLLVLLSPVYWKR